MRRTLAGIAGTAALALVLAGCGGSSSGSDTKASDNKSVDPASLKADLTWWDTSDPTNEAPTFKALIEKFNQQYPNVHVNYQSVPFGDAQNKFKTAAAAHKGTPDILRAEVAWVSDFASKGYLYQLDGTPLMDDKSDFLPTPLSADEYNGHVYGVPQVTDTLALMYNKKLFAKAGISTPPKTWDEVAADAKQLKSKAHVDGIYINSAGYFLLPFMYGEGGDLVDVDAKKITVNSPENVKGITEAQKLVKSGAAVKPVANDPYGTMMTLFKSGKVAMIINGPWEVKNIESDPHFGGFDNLGVAPVPAGSAGAGAPVGGHNYVISSDMPDSKAAAAIAFVKFMDSAQSQAFVAKQLGLLPTRQSAYDLPEVKDNAAVAAFKPALDEAHTRPWIPEGGQFFVALDTMATQVMVQGADVKKSLDTAAKTYKNEVVKDYSLN
jgi:arabinogalactan oligomer/maltooligosaccharide transport system substrate-binding protein